MRRKSLAFVFAVSVQVSLIGCSPRIIPESARAQLKELTNQCLGQIRNGALLVFQAGSESTQNRDHFADGLDFGKYSRLGNKVLGWNQDGLVLVGSNGRITFKDVELSAPIIDLSADGRFLGVTGTDRRDRKTGILLIDDAGSLVRHVSSGADVLTVSPNGSSLAFESAGQVRIVGELEALAVPTGSRLPSWSSSGDKLTVLSSGEFQIVGRQGQIKRVPARGTPLGPMQWSANDRAGMYVSRTASDYWSAPSCTDGFRIVVVNLETGVDFEFHQGCATYAERTQWLPVEACSG
jgi:hypothetical protein